MCGILAVFGCSDNSQAKRARIIELSRRLRHRGPDWSGLHCHEDCYLAHQRLAIVDPASGDQPLYNEDKTIIVTVNGEIYNHMDLRAKLKSHEFRTGSDCEVIAHLYEEYGEDFVGMLDGMFSFVLLNTRDNSFIAARDPIGITPLYMGWGLDGSIWFASEMKALSDDCERFISFLPGHIYSSKSGALRRWYNPPWNSECIPSTPYDPLVLRQAFEKAVVKRLMTDVPFGVLLSGGLDSSLVAAVASRYLAESKVARQWGSKLHTFCIGLKGSPDLKAAREVADYLGTHHHEFYFTVQEGIDAVEEVIYHIETYDVTTIRASTPMFLMSRKIKSLGVKMVLSGEGSDEIFGGYLYFHKAPNKEVFHQETCRKIKALHLYDCLRANKSTSAWGVEARVPFLDKDFINVAMDIDPQWKMVRPDIGRIEKWVLRNAFDDDQNPYLPKHILYRQKEQFSDGVGYSWIDGLKDHANRHISDAILTQASFIYPENTPTTKEAYYYRTIFEKFFPKNAARSTVPGGPSVACSTAKALEWDAAWSKNPDPSGRAALGIHDAAYNQAVDSLSVNNSSPFLNIPQKLQEGGAAATAI
ncbi:asparagine synthetase [glutamine-hydrolyzing] 2-like [Telopea speciosissima]|uniref:asparagine synthetase [glutamine-hydrolyzing] 2-like n=1 Tax=Telopea speciosissima TaxID=54955 RepID=UPI001CC34303|nr:asparagine synthetase [glutamine-hydrolyzing] 2-like [Telopea speciosissima]XP_043719336.1 asparagine synthetase [glutamine-hydrolyzing] 2-like [Telopea speciosissima]